MTKARASDMRHAKIWCAAFLLSSIIGGCSVAYAYSGEQFPKNPTTPMVIALAESFGVR